MIESRQVLRARVRGEKKKGAVVEYQEYFIPMKRISRNGVEYTYYKRVIDKVGLNKDDKSTI